LFVLFSQILFTLLLFLFWVLKRAHVDESECGGCEEMGSSLDLKGGDKWMSIVERILSAAAYQTCITSESTKGHLKTNS